MGGHRILDGIDDPGADIGVAEFVLGLRLENWFLHLDRVEDADNAVANVQSIEFFAGELVNAFEDPPRKAERWVPPSLV